MKVILLIGLLVFTSLSAVSGESAEERSLRSSLKDSVITASHLKAKVYNRRHQVIFQLFGSTQALGFEYSYRFWEKENKKIGLETGLGLGTPSLLFFGNMNPSHHLRAVFSRNRRIYPYLGYFGVWSNSNYYIGEKSGYQPHVGGGFRIGNSDKFTVKLGASLCLNCLLDNNSTTDYGLVPTSFFPTLGLHVPFGHN